jgi:hypothetical protein
MDKSPEALSWQDYKNQLRGMAMYEVLPDFQVGFNSFKIRAIEQSAYDILPLQPQLQPKTSTGAKSRGYGVSFTFKLD